MLNLRIMLTKRPKLPLSLISVRRSIHPHSRRNESQFGFSLIEMMISITLGLLVLAATATIFSSELGTHSAVSKQARLHQDARAVMEFMARDLRRNGYFSGDVNAAVNPFTGEWSVNDDGSCVTYAYDVMKDGTLNADDKFGFRLRNGAISVRRNAAQCTANTNWENITDPNTLTVTRLSFSKAAVFCTNITTNIHTGCLVGNADYVAPVNGDMLLETSDITIELSANLASDHSIAMTKTQVVRIKNDVIRVF